MYIIGRTLFLHIKYSIIHFRYLSYAFVRDVLHTILTTRAILHPAVILRQVFRKIPPIKNHGKKRLINYPINHGLLLLRRNMNSIRLRSKVQNLIVFLVPVFLSAMKDQIQIR